MGCQASKIRSKSRNFADAKAYRKAVGEYRKQYTRSSERFTLSHKESPRSGCSSMRTSHCSRVIEAAETLGSSAPASRTSKQSSSPSIAVSMTIISNAPEVTQEVTHNPLVLTRGATFTLVPEELFDVNPECSPKPSSTGDEMPLLDDLIREKAVEIMNSQYTESSAPPLKSASDTESEPSDDVGVVLPAPKKSKKKKNSKSARTRKSKRNKKKPARKSKKVSKKSKKVKIPKTPSEPKIDPKLEEETEEVDTPETSPEPKKDPELLALELESALLSKKIAKISERRDLAHATKGHDHPSVTKLNRQLRGLGKKLRNVAVKRYAFRSRSNIQLMSCI